MAKKLADKNPHGKRELVYKAIFFGFLSVLLLFLDARLEQTKVVRHAINYAMTPLAAVNDSLVRQHQGIVLFWMSRTASRDRILKFREENLRIKEELDELRQVDTDNLHLQDVVDYQEERPADRAQVARMIGGQLYGPRKEIIFNLGADDGIQEDMFARTIEGLLGQVTLVGKSNSRALLVTDPRHSVPVVVERSGNKFIIDGIGDDNYLFAAGLHVDLDVVVGDVLLTSGFGDKFPPGIPVARVSNIEAREGLSLRDLYATPFAPVLGLDFILIDYGLENRTVEVNDAANNEANDIANEK